MKRKYFFAAIAAAAMTMGACSSGEKAAQTADSTVKAAAAEVAAPAKEAVSTPTDDSQLAPGKEQPKVTVIDFNATWCGPCKRFAPAFDAAAKAFSDKADFVSVDIDQFPQTAAAFGVQNVPTIVVLSKEGKELKRWVGIGGIETPSEFADALKGLL